MSSFYKLGCLFCLIAIVFAGSAYSQQQESDAETLSQPVSVSNQVGVYKGINQIPESVRRSEPFARMLYEMKHYAGVEGIYDRQIRIDAFEQSKMDLLRDESASYKVEGSKLPIFANAWTNVGPTNTGGCTKALAFDPGNGNIIYAGAAGGGVWKTLDAGNSWTPLTDLVIPDLNVGAIAIDPSAPNTVYVGSGDPSLASDGLDGTGLYKSTDAGATWAKTGATSLPGKVNKIVVHPTNSNIVLACSYDNNRGLYRSIDAGKTFTKVFPTNKNSDGIIWDVAVGQLSGSKYFMYFVEGNNVGGGSTECGVYKSLDDGATWAKISSGGLPTGNNIGKVALAIPSGDKTKIYCLMAKPDGNLQGLWKSVNSGLAFTSVATVPSTVFNPNGNSAQGWYDLYLAIAPHTSTTDTLYIGGVEAYYSFNGGTSWNSYSDYTSHFNVHVDHQSIAIDPTNSRRVYIGTDGGVYRTLDAGQNWSYRSSGMMTMRFYHIGLDKSDFKKTYGGAQDQGVYRITTGQGPAFVFGGDGFQPIVDPTNSNIYYTEGPFGDIYQTVNGGNNFNPISDPGFEQADWDAPFFIAPHSNTTLFSGRTMLWRTVNSGSSWSTISPTFGSSYIHTVGLSPSNSSVYWIGLDAGKIKLSINSGSTWADKSTGTPNATVNSIVCHPNDATWALAAFSTRGTAAARVMRTTNSGTSWTNVSGGSGKILPGVPVNCVALDSTNPTNIWYAATDNGIYYTLDAGATWSIAGSGLGLAPSWDVQVHSNKVTIRIGTHGRSIWEANVNILPVEFTGLIATKTSSGTKLDWKTDSERSNSGFWVERSFNYQPFENLFFVTGAGNSNTEKSYTYLDPEKTEGYYIYRLKQVDLDGSTHLSNIVDLSYGTSGALSLTQNFPNPFSVVDTKSGSTRIRYSLPSADEATLRIYSTSGALIRTLVDHQMQTSGEQDSFWDGSDDSGKQVTSGAYYYSLDTKNTGKLSNKLIFIGK